MHYVNKQKHTTKERPEADSTHAGLHPDGAESQGSALSAAVVDTFRDLLVAKAAAGYKL